MGDVVQLNVITKLDIDPDTVLSAALGKLSGVIVIGYTADGDEYFAGSYADSTTNLWLAERFKKMLLSLED